MALRTVYAARDTMVRYVPLPYAFGDDYGPTPPWFDRVAILQNDPDLIWRSAPNVHRTYLDMFSPVHTEADRLALLRRFAPAIPAEFQHNPTWEIRLNAQGDRDDDAAASTAPDAVRIACVGDSWTFGMPVSDDQTYPSRLAAWLRQERPDRRFEVRNFGVLGYSSFQGLRVLKSRVLAWKPDIVAIGFAMNDSMVAGYRDKDLVGGSEHPSLGRRAVKALASAVTSSEDYKLLDYEARVLTFRPKPIETYLTAQADAKGAGAVDYDALEPWTRVSPRDYAANIREMVALARSHGASVVLLDNEVWDRSPYRPVLRELSASLGVPLVDSLALIAGARNEIEQQLERRLNLHPSVAGAGRQENGGGATTTVVFRVSRGQYGVPKALSIVGTDPELGSLRPNTILMHDDGTDGDERAGDGVWSYTATLPRGKSIAYVYTNSGGPGTWEGLDVPHIRGFVVPASPDGGPVYLPIETFGRVYMQGDDWHTNAAGYDLIAHRVAGIVEQVLTRH
jgi:lysophospholipase L1-like esterase